MKTGMLCFFLITGLTSGALAHTGPPARFSGPAQAPTGPPLRFSGGPLAPAGPVEFSGGPLAPAGPVEFSGSPLAPAGPARFSGPAPSETVLVSEAHLAGWPHLPKGLFAVNAKVRLGTLKSLDSQDLESAPVQQKLMEMALMDASVAVRMEAEKALSRAQPLNAEEQKWQFQLSSPFLYERKRVLAFMESHSISLNPYLQYTLLKELVFSPGLLVQPHSSEEDRIKKMKSALSKATNIVISSHLLMQKVLVSTLGYPDLTEISRQILSSIPLSPPVQWELMQMATAPPSHHNNHILGDQAFVIMSQTKELNLAVEWELLQLAMTEEPRWPLTEEPRQPPAKAQSPLSKDPLADKGQLSPSYLAFSLLQSRKGLRHETEKALAEQIVSPNPDVSEFIRERARNLLETQYFLRPVTEQVLIRASISASPFPETLKTVEKLFDRHNPSSETVETLIRIVFADYISPPAKKTAWNILLRARQLKPEQKSKLGWLFSCQRIFRQF